MLNTVNNKEQAQLVDQLKKFGLNPKDWFIQAFSQGKYWIQHRDDSQFVFLGEATFYQQKQQWNKISLWKI